MIHAVEGCCRRDAQRKLQVPEATSWKALLWLLKGDRGTPWRCQGHPGQSQVISSLEQLGRQLGSDSSLILRCLGSWRGPSSQPVLLFEQQNSQLRLGWVLPSPCLSGTSLFFKVFIKNILKHTHERRVCEPFCTHPPSSELTNICQSCFIYLLQIFEGKGRMEAGVFQSISQTPYPCTHKSFSEPWLVWLSGLGVSLQTERLPVWFSVRAHAGLWARSAAGGVQETTNRCVSPSSSLPSPLSTN